MMTCHYCGKKREDAKFCIGASLIDSVEPGTGRFAWTMWEGTAKVSCDNRDCWEKGRNQSTASIARLGAK